MTNRKIRKLNEMIEQAKKELVQLEDRLRLAKGRMDRGEISKADFTKARMTYSEKIKGKRTLIARWEKARLNEEHKLREKKEDDDEEEEKRKGLRAERRREREKEKRRALKGGADGSGEQEQKPRGFFSFFRRK
jgi:hypothetical protein